MVSRRTLVRVGLVVAVLATVGVYFLSDDSPSPPAWRDCTAPQLRETLPVDDDVESLTLETSIVASVEAPVTVLDVGDRLLIGTQLGLVIDAETGEDLLDLSDQVIVGAEQGLFDLELSADRSWLYVSYTEAPEGTSRVRAWRWSGEALDVDDAVDILELPQPHRHHNGGGIVFGPDGMLYVGFGDGGVELISDAERARDISSWYGSILRIEPTPGRGGFDVPPDNPYVGVEGAAEEIAFTGLRNPWQFSFDADGQLWIADVGHFCVEEINLVPAGRLGDDFGWPGLEGTHEWTDPDLETTPPVYEYLHTGLVDDKVTCAISGGEVYQGAAIPALREVYVFTDICDGTIRGVRVERGQVIEYDLGVSVESPVAIISDRDGELLIASFEDEGTVFRLTDAS